MDKLKQKWENLSLRERWIVSVASVIIVVFLIYELLLSPLSDSVTNLQQQVKMQQNLVQWMMPRVNALREKSARSNIQQIKPGELLSFVDTRLKQSKFANAVSEVSQSANGEVQVSFKQVSFDDLIAWLINRWQQAHIAVNTMDVSQGSKPGLVRVTMTLIVKK